MNLIVAIDEQNAIGKQGNLLCHLSADLKHFKALTTGHTVVMGSRTYLSLPRHPLPNRRNIVLTHQDAALFEGAEVVRSIEEILKKYCLEGDAEDFLRTLDELPKSQYKECLDSVL